MSWKRSTFEAVVTAYARRAAPRASGQNPPRSVFVLRNNDLGDVLTTTPLFAALKRLWPSSRVIAGVGNWAAPLLAHNPHVDEVLPLNAPWHNKFLAPHPHNSLRGLLGAFRYIISSPEVSRLRERRCDVGLDVLGSPQGALLLARAGIPRRVGVRGYAGGHRACTDFIEFSEAEYVGRSALRLVGLLGLPETLWPPVRPQVYLTKSEIDAAETTWAGTPPAQRLLVSFKGGDPAKSWPAARYRSVLERLSTRDSLSIRLVGGPTDKAAGDELAAGLPAVRNLAGAVSLRETLALVATAGRVLCPSTFVMHAAAAFDRPTLVVLGANHPSARAETVQWSCNPRARLLGPEPAQPRVATPDEVLDALLALPAELPISCAIS